MNTVAVVITAVAVVFVSVLVYVLYRRESARDSQAAAAIARYLGLPASRTPVLGIDADGEIAGRTFQYALSRPNRNTRAQFQIWLAARGGGELVLRRERRGDGVAKSIGLVAEVQTGDDAFDAAVFVDTAEPAFAARLFADADARRAAQALLDGGYDRVMIDEQRVAAMVVNVSPAWGLAATLDAAGAVSALAALAELQPRLPPHLSADRRRAWKIRLAVLYSIVAMVAIAGTAAMMLAFDRMLPLDRAAVFNWSLLWSLPAMLLWAGMSLLVLRGHSATVRHLFISVASGVFAFGIAGFGGVMCVNARTDTSDEQHYQPAVIDQHVSRGRHGSTYYAVVKSWRSGRTHERFTISAEDYASLRVGHSRAQIVTRSGGLGFEWWQVARVQAETAGDEPGPRGLPNFVD